MDEARPAGGEPESEKPALLARPMFVIPFTILCLGGAVYKRRGDEKQRLAKVWEQRCLGNAQCQANAASISDYCYSEYISVLRPRSGASTQRKRYVGCVVETIRHEFSYQVDPPDGLTVNYF